MHIPRTRMKRAHTADLPPGSSRAYYLYGIARPRADRAPGPLPAAGIIPAATVYTLAYRQLLAVVSAVPLAAFAPISLDLSLRDPGWVQERTLAHQRVLAALIESYTILPCVFCTLYQEEAHVRMLLDRQYDAFERMIGRVAGATEWGVNIFCDREILSQWIETTATAQQTQREALAHATPGADYLLRKKLAQATGTLVDELGKDFVHDSYQRLAARARAAAANAVQPPHVHGRQADMAMNAAFLVDNDGQVAFQVALAILQEEYAPRGFAYELTGPWPPYSFAALHLQDTPNAAARIG